MTKTLLPAPLLKFALLLDAGISGATAALQLGFTDALVPLLQLPHALLTDTGLFFVAYVALLLAMAFSRRVWSGLVGLVAFGNAGWAAGCVALLASGVLAPSAWGVAFVAVQAAAVLLFALLQWQGWRQSLPAGPASALAG